MGVSHFLLLITSVIVALCSFLFYTDNLKDVVGTINDLYLDSSDEDSGFVYSPQRLATFDGEKHEKLYLSLLGNIFDVSKGQNFYKKGSSYHYFIGKDGSRAFITGNFQDESEIKDHVLDLSCNELFTLLNWVDTMKEKYEQVGVLNGRYYQKNGQETEYTKQLIQKKKGCEIEKETNKIADQNYPPCNMEWNADDGARVWCTKSSGGIKRSWTGVPRQLYTPGHNQPKCVCVNTNAVSLEKAPGLIKEYANCSPESTACNVKS